MIGVSALTAITWFAVSSFIIHEIARGSNRPVQLAYVNSCASEDKGATIISFESMVSSIGGVIGLISFGLIARKTGIETVWLLASVAVLILIPVYLKAKQHNKISN